MRIPYYRELNPQETYPITKKRLKQAFSPDEEAAAFFGLRRKFQFDSRQPDKPHISGTVVASVYCTREKTISLSFFPLKKVDYPEETKQNFFDEVLPKMKDWMTRQEAKPETAIVGVEELIVEWDGQKHELHYSKYL